ncbi:flavin-containing monooxygenase [Gulosibacter molinativorax]|uniref:NAD(P)/FAD-dependent oxidoreductase n=1 Tax=Gulosibacter molinativorax TaxID=256821 RepID=A0ABT7C6X3_9MICO|nr:NAD(P)/FAD-dependent oxidoreductase [Gulosibacter molinativorax]MDJ1370858.1 NAD(P)/FAD-dependent oxidoreductase [Gulosibacter molinativorax]QUY62195.1 Cyclohexanone monooxygenase [Gulosibacter molinativorax]
MSTTTTTQTVDAIVIGAGFGGIQATHRLGNEFGMTVKAFDKAAGPGGTWYWNRYPGAMSDTESHIYRFSFDKEMLQEDTWSNTYLMQADILANIERVMDRYDLWQYFEFNTEVTSAIYLEDAELWEVTTSKGDVYRAKYVVNALGLLSAVNLPDIKGMDTFEGEILHTGAYPEGKDLTGLRVGVIGSGSTGTQVVTALGPKVKHLTHFIRTPQYSVPSGFRPVDEAEVLETRENFDAIWDQVKNSAVAFGFDESTTPALSVSEEERQRVYQEAWERGGGFRFMFGTFGDIATDLEANETAAAFIRSKIRETVKDEEKARKLTPTDLYARRPLCDGGFFETFNRDNVDVVALKETPIEEIVPNGIRTADGTVHELDVIIFATGFDAVDGNYRRMNIRGRNGIHINEYWDGQPTSFLGVATANFPNWFMVLGPNGPFTNLVPSIETQVEWFTDFIKHAEDNGLASIEPSQESVDEWTKTCSEIADMTVFGKVDSWIFGANVAGKTRSVLFYVGGLKNYRDILKDIADNDYRGFELRSAVAASVAA